MIDVTPKPIDKTPGAPFHDGIAVLATRYPRGTHLALHRHETAQLLFAVRGTMQVTTPAGRWLVPPQRAVWVPPRFAHAVDMLSEVEMRSTYIAAGAPLGGWAGPMPETDRVIAVSPLLRAAILGLFAPDLRPERRRALAALLVDEVGLGAPAPTFVPMPRSPPMIRLAEEALADLSARLDLSELAARAGTSVRSASRLFPRETSLTFKAWRQRIRIMAALEQMGAGASVKETARRLGFSSSAAFAAAFRAVIGRAPGQFIGAEGPAAATAKGRQERPARPKPSL